MPANPAMLSPQEYRQALRSLATAQRAQLTQFVQQTEAMLARDWQAGMAATPDLYRPLLDQYARSLALLRAEMDDPSAKLSLSWLTSQNAQLQRIEAQIRAAIDGYAARSAQVVSNAQAFAVQQGATDSGALVQQSLWPALDKGITPGLLWNRPNPDALASLVGRTGSGHALGDLFANWGVEAASQARQVLMLGIATGSNPRTMVTGLAQALDISRQRAAVIARTEVLNAYRDAALENYRRNSDVVQKWVWSAGGPNPCACCMGMDGLEFELWEQMDSHPCCACAALPETKPWSDILGPLGIDTSDIPDYSLANTYIPGAERFTRMSATQQRAIIGTQAGYDAYKRGEVTLRDFVGRRPDGMFYQRSLRDIRLGRNAYFDDALGSKGLLAETASTRETVQAAETSAERVMQSLPPPSPAEALRRDYALPLNLRGRAGPAGQYQGRIQKLAPPANPADLTPRMQQALTAYRSAQQAWADAIAGTNFAPLPDFYTQAQRYRDVGIHAFYPYQRMTKVQRTALRAAREAIQKYNDAFVAQLLKR